MCRGMNTEGRGDPPTTTIPPHPAHHYHHPAPPLQPSEVGPCFVFLASQEASYMTGQVLHPNGGSVRWDRCACWARPAPARTLQMLRQEQAAAQAWSGVLRCNSCGYAKFHALPF